MLLYHNQSTNTMRTFSSPLFLSLFLVIYTHVSLAHSIFLGNTLLRLYTHSFLPHCFSFAHIHTPIFTKTQRLQCTRTTQCLCPFLPVPVKAVFEELCHLIRRLSPLPVTDIPSRYTLNIIAQKSHKKTSRGRMGERAWD